jgi:hypothetical protein
MGNGGGVRLDLTDLLEATSWKRPLAPAGLHTGESKTAAGGGSAPWPAAAQLKVACCTGAA